ncbi:MAG: septation regulator SpoVG [Endomicrobium sp.]|jgi:stage V sporulation protein G|nr:septation regulator SpoVG [Endomicrobium sp.]
MKITEVRVFPKNEERLKAYAAVTFDGCFVVHNLRIVKGEKGLMVCMPSRKKNDGKFKDIAHPVTNSFRNDMEKLVLKAYEEKMKEIEERAQLKEKENLQEESREEQPQKTTPADPSEPDQKMP